jgi:phosphoribosyl 1,2-cyclic phosphate phosphodiesterase
MRIEILGSGGAVTIPQPGCDCRVCVEARARGVPYSRTGPSFFVHGPDLLIDTPEESKYQLNRAGLGPIPACVYSHWHPDHVMGRRVWEANKEWRRWPPHSYTTDIYLPQQVAEDFRTHLGSWEQFEYMASRGMVRLILLEDGESFALGGVNILPFRVAEDYVYAFLLQEGDTRVLIAPDELNGWTPPDFVRGVDAAFLPMGITEFDPFTGDRVIAEEHPVLRTEATYRETMEIVQALEAKRVVLGHIEEQDGLGYDDYERLGAKLRGEGFAVEFAYDTMTVEV